jgi:hypothetical protein
MSKHSPGPWTIGANDVLYTVDGEDIGVLGFGSKADDRLIAAAPEMLALLRKVASVRYIEDVEIDPILALLQRIDGSPDP